MNSDTLHASLAEIGHKVTLAGAGTTVSGWLVSNEGLGVLGFVVAVLGFVANLYFKRKDDARHQALFEAEMAAIKARGHE